MISICRKILFSLAFRYSFLLRRSLTCFFWSLFFWSLNIISLIYNRFLHTFYISFFISFLIPVVISFFLSVFVNSSINSFFLSFFLSTLLFLFPLYCVNSFYLSWSSCRFFVFGFFISLFVYFACLLFPFCSFSIIFSLCSSLDYLLSFFLS